MAKKKHQKADPRKIRLPFEKGDTKKRPNVGSPNTHQRWHLCLTPKQVREIIEALRLAATTRSREADRLYLLKVIKDIAKQEDI